MDNCLDIGTVNAIGGPAVISAAAPTEAVASLASVDCRVVVTFNQNVDNGGGIAPPNPFLSTNINPAINSQVSTMVPTAIAPAPYPAAGSTTETYFFDTEVIAQPLASGSIKFGAGTVLTTASNFPNANTTVGPLTAA